VPVLGALLEVSPGPVALLLVLELWGLELSALPAALPSPVAG